MSKSNQYLVILDYTNGQTVVLQDSEVNPNNEDRFDYDEFVEHFFPHCDTSWIICNSITIGTKNNLRC